MTYLLDTNVFISAKDRHYGFDTVPGFWDWLDKANARGIVFSIREVGDELYPGTDELAKWAKKRHKTLFLPADARRTQNYADMLAWVVTQKRFTDAAVNTFLGSADHYLVAHALSISSVVVTHEVSAPESKKIVKLPDVCTGMKVECMNPFQMLRAEKAVFVLS